MKSSRRIMLVGMLVCMLALVGCGSSEPTIPKSTELEGPEISFGSYVDTEGQVVGAAVVQVLQANGVNVIDRTKFGTPDVVRKAYLQGDLDGALDYTGSGAFYVGPESDPIWSDPLKGYEAVKTKDLEQNGIVWTTPAPANNTESIAVTAQFAVEHGLKTLDDLARYINDGGKVILIGGQTWLDRDLGFKGIQEAYGFTLPKSNIIGLSDGNTAQFLKALAQGTDGVNAAEVYATDGGLADLNMVVLEDTKSIPPVYNPCPVFRKEAIEAYPQIESILKPLFDTLTIERLQELNKAVAIDGKDPKVVATDYLKTNGLLPNK